MESKFYVEHLMPHIVVVSRLKVCNREKPWLPFQQALPICKPNLIFLAIIF